MKRIVSTLPSVDPIVKQPRLDRDAEHHLDLASLPENLPNKALDSPPRAFAAAGRSDSVATPSRAPDRRPPLSAWGRLPPRPY